MNIFVLSPSGCPLESARFHCDQHMNKMILESAQMLSTAFFHWGVRNSWLYKPAYMRHPCTIWTKLHYENAYWLCKMAEELEVIRQEIGSSNYHGSSDVIKFCKDYLEDEYLSAISVPPASFVFAGPVYLALNNKLSVPEKYQAYYKFKHRAWLDMGRGMTYKGRPIPDFMQEILAP